MCLNCTLRNKNCPGVPECASDCGLEYGDRMGRKGAGHESVTKQRENPMQRQVTAWLVQGSGRGLEWPTCVMSGGW